MFIEKEIEVYFCLYARRSYVNSFTTNKKKKKFILNFKNIILAKLYSNKFLSISRGRIFSLISLHKFKI